MRTKDDRVMYFGFRDYGTDDEWFAEWSGSHTAKSCRESVCHNGLPTRVTANWKEAKKVGWSVRKCRIVVED
jgi:hypothetical protein